MAENGSCAELAAGARTDSIACAHSTFDDAPIGAPSSERSCERLFDEPSALAHAVQRCDRGDAAYCFVADMIERRDTPRAFATCVVVTAIDGTRRSIRTYSRLTTTSGGSRPIQTTATRLATACAGGHGPACVLSATESDDAHDYARACEAGVLAACGMTLARFRTAAPSYASALERARAACSAGSRSACAYAAFGEARLDTPGAIAAACDRLDAACGRDGQLPRRETDPEDPLRDDPETLEDDRLEALDEWSEDDMARVDACSALVFLSAASSARIDRRSAARSVLRAACANESSPSLSLPCTSLALALERGLGGPRDRRLAALAREAAAEREEEP